jgi:hypothetical protein
VLAPNNPFLSDDDVRLEVRELIQAFLLAREDVIPLPKTPRIVLAMSEDSQQDENAYWSDDMYDIPDIVDIKQGQQDEISQKDIAVQQVSRSINTNLSIIVDDIPAAVHQSNSYSWCLSTDPDTIW